MAKPTVKDDAIGHVMAITTTKINDSLEKPNQRMAIGSSAIDGKGWKMPVRVANASREIDTFLDRNCGMMILLFLVSKGVPDETITGALRATVSISGLARRFGVSRPHVRKLLADAEAEGLVGDATGETPIRLLPRAIEGFEKFYASTFLTFAQAIRAAAQEMEDIQG